MQSFINHICWLLVEAKFIALSDTVFNIMQRKHLGKLYFRREEKNLNGSKGLHFTRSSVTSKPEDGDKLHMNIAILRATTKNSIERDILRNTTNQDGIKKNI